MGGGATHPFHSVWGNQAKVQGLSKRHQDMNELTCSKQGTLAGALHPHICQYKSASLDQSMSHLQGLALALKQAPLALSHTAKAKSGSHSVDRSCAGSKGGLCLVHRSWACISRGAPVGLEANPKLPSGGVTQGVGYPTPLSLPVTELATSGMHQVAMGHASPFK